MADSSVYPILEPDIIKQLNREFPDVSFMIAPDEYTLSKDRFCGVHCDMLPIQNNLGYQATLDLNMFDTDRTRLLTVSYEVIDYLCRAHREGLFPKIGSLKVSALPTLVRNPTSAQSPKCALFSFDLAGHLLHKA
ncbi:hypothetical protein [Mobiluncus curtisii]|uniref:hypothetical protein n=1 Tax=Mobiluncus curtisii TaxID=2051 RepID=UPI002432FD38|nr:hypothetical protein [Mobiluncus curtisii]